MTKILKLKTADARRNQRSSSRGQRPWPGPPGGPACLSPDCHLWFLVSGQAVMAAARGPLLAAALLLLSWGHHCVSPPPPCPDLCTCRSDAALINCSSAGLNLVPRHIPDSVAELHLSHNRLSSAASDRPLPRLRALWLDSNGMARLSLCVDRTPGGRRGHRIRPWSGRWCVSWAPALQLLSVERNQLQQLPEGESVVITDREITPRPLNITPFSIPEHQCPCLHQNQT